MELTGYDIEPMYSQPEGKPEEGWFYGKIPQVRTVNPHGQTLETITFTKGNNDSDEDVLRRANNQYESRVNHYLRDWQEQEGQSNELSDLLRAEYMPRAYLVSTETKETEANIYEFYSPRLTDRTLTYTTDGQHFHSIVFNDNDSADEFYARAYDLLLDSYLIKMHELAAKEDTDRQVFLISHATQQVYEVFNHGDKATLGIWDPVKQTHLYRNDLNPDKAIAEARELMRNSTAA